MSCRRICGGAGGARHADARPSTRDLAPPAPRVRRGRKTQPVPRAPGCLVHKFMKRTRVLARVDRGARLAASACVLRGAPVVPGDRALSLFPHASLLGAPLHLSRLRMVHCSPHRCSPCVRDCGQPANATPDSRAAIAARRLCLLARLGVACAYGSVLGWGRVLSPPFGGKLPAHCTCAVPSGARINNVDH